MGSKKYFSGTRTGKLKTSRKRKYEKESPVSSKSKKIKKIRQKSHKSSSQLNEYVQHETSSVDLTTPCQQISRTPSSNSVIYVTTYPQKDNTPLIPLIDLTKSSHSIVYSTISSKFPSTSSLKLIYKSNNFNNRADKHLNPSLLTVPLRRNLAQTGNVNSSSNITRCSRDKLSILDIPPEFFDYDTDDSEYAFYSLSKANLNEEAKSPTENVTMREDDNESFYSLESKASTQNMCQLYEVLSKDNFQ